jgi:hypothetical protein
MTNDKLQQFDELCKVHDLTYTYSDDHSVYQKGKHQYAEIMQLSEHIPYNEARNIWNKNVMEKLNAEYAGEFLWT